MIPWSLPEFEFSRRNRLVLYYLVGLVVLVLCYTVLYNVLLARLEGVDQSLFASFEFIVQTMTTTGYGQDSGYWSRPLMFLFVAGTQISGIALGFFTLRLIIIPLFTDADVNLDDRLTPKSDHVVICEYRRDSAVLLDELRELDIEYVLISSDRDDAKSLSDAGYAAIHGSPQDASAFERASIGTARAVVTDAGAANVNTILTAKSVREDVDIIALSDDGDMRDVLRDAGADSVLSPHGLLGRRLAEKAVSAFGEELDSVALGGDLEVTELPILHGSPLIGTRIRNSQIREASGANIVGAWIDGELQLPPNPDAVIRDNTVLLVSGGHDALERFSDVTQRTRGLRRPDCIIVVGQGEVGQAASETVTAADIDLVTVDTEDRNDVDIVGDVGSKSLLRKAGIDDAGAIIIGLADDSQSLLTAVVARSLNPDIEVLVRVNDTDATRKALSAGADYVLSVPRVSARMLATELRGEEVLAPASQIRLIRVPATPFAGSTIAESGIFEESGCRIIALEDEDGLQSTIDPVRRLTGDERLTLAGPDEAVRRFLKRFDVTPVDGAPEQR